MTITPNTRFTLALLIVGLMGFSLPLSAGSIQPESALPIPGIYEVVTLRRASDVAAPANPMNDSDSPIGQTITIDTKGIAMTGLACEDWQVSLLTEPVVNLDDPTLADIDIPPTDSPISSGDQRVMKSYSYHCEGEHFIDLIQVDDRVIVIPWANSSQYLIAEVSLTSEQITQFQKQLKSMKFFHSAPNGVLDEETLRAINYWVEDRIRTDDYYHFSRPAITENLLDALHILDTF